MGEGGRGLREKGERRRREEGEGRGKGRKTGKGGEEHGKKVRQETVNDEVRRGRKAEVD